MRQIKTKHEEKTYRVSQKRRPFSHRSKIFLIKSVMIGKLKYQLLIFQQSGVFYGKPFIYEPHTFNFLSLAWQKKHMLCFATYSPLQLNIITSITYVQSQIDVGQKRLTSEQQRHISCCEIFSFRAENQERIHIPRDFSNDILGIGVGIWSSTLVKNFSLTHLSLVNSKKDILLTSFQTSLGICILSRFSALEIRRSLSVNSSFNVYSNGNGNGNFCV